MNDVFSTLKSISCVISRIEDWAAVSLGHSSTALFRLIYLMALDANFKILNDDDSFQKMHTDGYLEFCVNVEKNRLISKYFSFKKVGKWVVYYFTF